MKPLREIIACCRVAALLIVMFLILGAVILWEGAFDLSLTNDSQQLPA
jgi:hypothetical protein